MRMIYFGTFEKYSSAINTGHTDLLVIAESGKILKGQNKLANLFPDWALTAQYTLKKGGLSGTYKTLLLLLIVGSSIIALILGVIVLLITKSYILRNSTDRVLLYSLGYSKKEVAKIVIYENGI